MDNTIVQLAPSKKKIIVIAVAAIVVVGVAVLLIIYRNKMLQKQVVTEREKMAQILNKNATTPTTQERIDVAKQLNQINKPAVSTKTTGGKIVTPVISNTQTQDRTAAALLLNKTH